MDVQSQSNSNNEVLFKAPEPTVTFKRPESSGPPEKYTENDLHHFMPQIRDYMSVMAGEHTGSMGDEEILDMYVNRMRGFAGGNSVRAGREIVRLNQLDEEQLATVGEAYSIFNNMEGMFSGELTLGERGEIAKDYARTMLLDPLNILTLGIGKAVASGSAKGGAKIAQKLAMKAYQKELSKQTAKGVAKKVAKEAATKEANKMYGKAMVRAGREAGKALTAAEAKREATTGFGKLTTTAALKEIGVTTGLDSVVAVGAELAYQEGMVRTGVQEDHSWANAGLAALGTMIVGGIAAGSVGLRGVSGNKVYTDPGVDQTNARAAMVGLADTVKRNDDWFQKVAKGKKLEDLDTDFWLKFILGDEEAGMEGMLQVLEKSGYIWQRTGKEDKVSNWLADVIKDADPSDSQAFLQVFKDVTGAELPELTKGTVDDFANRLAAKMSQAGQLSNAASQVAQRLGKEAKDVTVEDMALDALGVSPTHKGKVATAIEDLSKATGKGIERFQNNTIRMIVSNFATTALNVQGWGIATMMNTAADVSMAALHGGRAGVKLMTGDIKDAKEAARMAQALARANIQKVRNLLDPNTTYEAYKALAQARPATMMELTNVLPGGIEDINKVIRQQGFDPNQTVVGQKVDELVEFAQTVTMVKAQDVYTKSQEFLYQIDKGLRTQYGIGYSQLLSDPKRAQMVLASKEYREIEAKATYETLRAIYSKSYKGKGLVGEVAGAIEDARNIPGIGLLVPFGRFFNNTLATLSDISGISVIGKLMGFQGERSFSELGMRAAVGWGLTLSLVDNEMEYMEKGLGWSESINPNTGEVQDDRYTFPASMFKAGARLMAYAQKDQTPSPEEANEIREMMQVWDVVAGLWEEGGQEIPPELTQQIREDVFGQLTRQLVDSTNDIGSVVDAIIRGEPEWADFKNLVTRIPSQTASGWMRFLEPLNVVAGIAKGTDFSVIDRRQGNELVNKSLRYVDQLIPVLKGEQKYDAARGPSTVDTGKFLGTRGSGHLSRTEQVMSTLGLPFWKLSGFSLDPKADNRYNQLFNSMIEEEAGKIWKSERFQKEDLEGRTHMWKKAVEDAEKKTLYIMGTNISKTGDRQLQKSYKVSTTYGKEAIDRALETLGMSIDQYDELTYEQLEFLENYIKERDFILDNRK